MSILNWTGERLMTEVNSELTVEHLHRYAVAKNLVRDKTVLDIACGEGYGSHILAETAVEVIGVDIAPDAVNHASLKYKKPNLKFVTGSASQIPLPDNSIDIIVSFETIEHHDKHEEMMLEFKRVLRSGGLVIISSPDKKYYTEQRGYDNPFHVKELYHHEFENLLKKYFSYVQCFKQGICYGSLIYSDKPESAIKFFQGSYNAVNVVDGLNMPLYSIAIAADSSFGHLVSDSFFETSFSVHVHKQQIDSILNSRTYKLGAIFTAPIKFILKKLR